MSFNLNYFPAFDGTNYGYWKAMMRLFLKSIDVWHIAESGLNPPDAATAEWTVVQTSAHLSNGKALNAFSCSFTICILTNFTLTIYLRGMGNIGNNI
jgi:carbonic anhydrase